MVLALGDPPTPATAPKIAVLSRLRRAGLPVPPGLGLRPDELADPAVRARVAGLLAGGPVIVRAALAVEDSSDTSTAGLGLSIAGCRDLAAVDRAAAEIAAAGRDPWLIHHAGGVPSHQLLVQREVARRWLAVVAADRGGARVVELHGEGQPDALSAGATPAFSGPLALSDPALAAPITSLFDHVETVLSETPAIDAELVIAPDGAAWLVQARPLVRPLTPGWDAFRAEVGPGVGPVPDLPGLWRLDAEHNPAALSPAHAGVIAWLADQAGAGNLRVLAGWLYERVVPAGAAPGDPHQALAALRERHLPAARRALADIEALLAADLHAGLARALEHLRATLAIYGALRVELPRELPADRAAPLSLRERAAYLDVLPADWDLASPALADLVDPTCLPGQQLAAPGPAPDREHAAVLVRELDDHLFALGLAPLRRVYLAAGARLGLGDDVFLLAPDELGRALADRTLPDLDARRRRQARRTGLRPPLALYDGRPVPLVPHRRLSGLPFGRSVQGPIARRRDLADLLARVPPAGAIVVLPALTAQAAVALRALPVRAVCCEHGGALSHAALMVRELELSALIGCAGCSELPDGLLVELDTRVGRLRPLSPGP